MIYDFSNKKEQDAAVESKLFSLKKEYQKQQMSAAQLQKLQETMEEAKMKNNKTENPRKKQVLTGITAACAFIAAFIILPNTSGTVAHAMGRIPVIGQLVEVVTFRDYEYESARHNADIQVPEIVVSDHDEGAEAAEDTAQNAKTPENSPQNAENSMQKDSSQTAAASRQSDSSQAVNDTQENLKQSVSEINTEIQEITDKIVAEFEADLKEEEGYQDVLVKHEVLTTTDNYFTLKLICYQGAGSGYEWNYYYTIDLSTGERLALKDLFVENADYITPISENIISQMQQQMAADENVMYWLDSGYPEWDFKTITEDTSFYVNEKDNLVIGFDEGEVGPMSMGTVEFEIPADVIQNIRK